MKVHWTEHARQQLRAIHAYIADDAPVYADQVVDKLTDRSDQLGNFPQSGRKVPEYDDPDIREVIVAPYRLVYRIKSDQVDVLSVLHGAQKAPHELADNGDD